MKMIVGLGNPGPEYVLTRHNAGLMLVDRIFNVQYPMTNGYGWRRKKEVFVAEFPNVVLIKTAGVFMNESGRLLSHTVVTRWSHSGHTMDNLYVAHDDLDIKLGEYKVQWGKGPKVHNGVTSIEEALGTKEFWRIRIGIDNRMSNQTISNVQSGEKYVLEKFTTEEKLIVEGVLDAIAQTIIGG